MFSITAKMQVRESVGVDLPGLSWNSSQPELWRLASGPLPMVKITKGHIVRKVRLIYKRIGKEKEKSSGTRPSKV